MSEDRKISDEMPEEEKTRLTRYIILSASAGFIVAGVFTLRHMKFVTSSGRALMLIMAGLPIGYGLSQIVNEEIRYHSQEEKKDESRIF